MLTLGVDEAGRGPLLGPLVMAAVCLETKQAARLSRAGVTDSKAFGVGTAAHARRSVLAELICLHATSVGVAVVDVAEVDHRVTLHELNVLEREHATRLIERAPPVDRIIADGKTLFAPLQARFPNLLCLDRAEERHVAVAAASVVAKVRRDELFQCIAKRYEPEFGPLAGGGYENVPTHAFVRAYLHKYGHLPPEARRAWNLARLADALPPGYDPRAELPRQI